MENIGFNRPRKIRVEPGKEKYANISRVDSSPWWLNSSQLMDEILKSLEKRRPCSIVSLGATEAFVMAQYTLLTEEEFMHHPEALVANRGVRGGHGHRGISFPNIWARDETVEAVRKAHIVGYN
ncbi:MAG: GT-D fold domain-containing glycosyltransferase, partial [Syntrophomonas sp.]|uniref:GT-D fold domain-containing glycosyltransferase n=1 Tax=Syntrophomonas sp. TaxID=2053627 RepID=UPI00260BD3B3